MVVLPSEVVVVFCFFINVFSDVGEIHRVVIFMYSRSPLSEPDCSFSFVVLFVKIRCRGDSQGSLSFILSFSPLCFSPGQGVSCRGDYTGELFLKLSFSLL